MLPNQLNITRRQALSLGGLTLGLSLASAARMAEAAPLAVDGPIWVPTKLEWRRLGTDPRNDYHELFEYDAWGNKVVDRESMDDGWMNDARYEYDQNGHELRYHVEASDSNYNGEWVNETDEEGRLIRATCVIYRGTSSKMNEVRYDYGYHDNGMLAFCVVVDELWCSTTTYTYNDRGFIEAVERVDTAEGQVSRKAVLGFAWQRDTEGHIKSFVEVMMEFDQQDDGAYVSAGESRAALFHVEMDEHGNLARIAGEDHEWEIEYAVVESPSKGAILRAMRMEQVMVLFMFYYAPSILKGGQGESSGYRKLVQVDASEGAYVNLSGTVFREKNNNAGAWQEVFYMLRLDNPVEFTGLDEPSPSTVATDKVKVASMIDFSAPQQGVPFDELIIPEWEKRVGTRVTCVGKLVGRVDPHHSEVNMVEAKVQQ